MDGCLNANGIPTILQEVGIKKAEINQEKLEHKQEDEQPQSV
jgi:hypothetical protein